MMEVKESIVDHVPDTDSTGRSPMEESSSVESSAASMFSDSQHGESVPKEETSSPLIASSENAAVRRFKTLIYGILLISALGISMIVFTYLRGSERAEFDRTFESYAFQVIDSVGTQLEQNMATLDSFALALLSHASLSSPTGSWPFVTLPDSALRMSKIRAQTKSSMLMLLNLVSDDRRGDYEDYSVSTHTWVNETLLFQSQDDSLTMLGLNLSTHSSFPETLSYGGQTVPRNSGPYAPSWQTYPLISAIPAFNVDYFRDPAFGPGLNKSVLSQSAVLTELIGATVFLKGNSTSEPNSEPFTSIFYPVVDGSKATAVLNLAFQWRMLFQNILREEERGLIIVVTNPCTKAISYRIDESEAVFLGFGDRHDTKYNDFVIAIEVNSLLGDAYSGIALDPLFCPHTIKAYPSEELEDDVKSIVPLMFTFGSVCIFLFTLVVFFIYDMLVAFRQQKMLKAGRFHGEIIFTSVAL